MLERWFTHVCRPLVNSYPLQQHGDAQSCTAAWRAAEALVRLHPLLPWQPEDCSSGRWRTAGEAAAAIGGVEAAFGSPTLAGQCIALMLAFGDNKVVPRLLALPPGVATPETAAAAFRVLCTVSRAAHTALRGMQPPGGGGGGSGGAAQRRFTIRVEVTDMLRQLDAAARLALSTHSATLPPDQQVKADRWAGGAGREAGGSMLEVCRICSG